MEIPERVTNWCLENGFGEIVATQVTGGGCINNGAVLKTSQGKTFFLKTNSHSPQEMFTREAEGLQALRIQGGPRIPIPYLWDSNFLLMEDLSPAPYCQDYWAVFGHRLACLHNTIGSKFGFQHDNYIGSTPQPNPWTVDGFEFFREHRLIFEAHLAKCRGLLNGKQVHQVEILAARLPELVPLQPASLIHGDLWGGNAISDSLGNPALIDPAVHYGWAEAELAMTTLFGSFPDQFYRAYLEIHPIQNGYRDRFPIYNLYHLLNHLNLFGSGYRGQVLSILSRYS